MSTNVSEADPFKVDVTSPNSANNTKLANTGFSFGTSTPSKNDKDIAKPVTPVSDHSPGYNDRPGSYSYGAPAAGSADFSLLTSIPKESDEDPAAEASSVKAPAPPANLNPTGVFSTIPGLGLGVNASSSSTPSLPAKPVAPYTGLSAPPASAVSIATAAAPRLVDSTGFASKATPSSGLGSPTTGEKRKAEDSKPGIQGQPTISSSIPKSLKATVEDFDSGAETNTPREPDAKKARKDDETETMSLGLSTAPVTPADSSKKPVEPEAVAETPEKTEKTGTTETATRKRGRPKKGKAEKKAPAPIGQTARKTRSQGPAA